tara:strand:+ start:92 stop:313 length:222 start_codon:yes stop_codon:yes gene_type:complete
MIKEFLLSFLPTNGGEKIIFSIDIFAIVVLLSPIALIPWLKAYILVITALSITITTAVKVYNLFTKNKKNKKL